MKVQPKVGHSDSQQLGAGSHPQTREYLDLINRTNNQLNAIKSHEKLAGPPQTQVSSLFLFTSLSVSCLSSATASKVVTTWPHRPSNHQNCLLTSKTSKQSQIARCQRPSNWSKSFNRVTHLGATRLTLKYGTRLSSKTNSK